MSKSDWRLMEATGAILLAFAVNPAGAQQTEAPIGPPPATVAAGADRATPAAEDGVVDVARERYEAARYDEALSVLDDAKPADGDVQTRAGIEQYRALCLFALGRDADATQAIERLFAIDPSYSVERLDASPSVVGRFREVRQRVLPAMVRDEYRAGKAAFEGRSYQAAADHLRRSLTLAAAAGSGDPDVEDVRTLAQGFLDLATAQIAAEQTAARAAAPAPAAAAPPAPSRQPPIIADPVPLRQQFPPTLERLQRLAEGREGVMELTIDASGHVTRAAMRTSIHPLYDELLLGAARNWVYRPATVDGRPISRTVTVVIRPGQR